MIILLTRSCSEVEGSRKNGRIRNIPSNFGVYILYSQNVMIPVSHVLKMSLENLKKSSFPKLGKTLKLCYNRNGTMFTITEKSRSNVFCNKQCLYKAIIFLNIIYAYFEYYKRHSLTLDTKISLRSVKFTKITRIMIQSRYYN